MFFRGLLPALRGVCGVLLLKLPFALRGIRAMLLGEDPSVALFFGKFL
jgi:hypothetical protein